MAPTVQLPLIKTALIGICSLQSINYMLKLLQSIKAQVTRSRNLSYYGKYSQAVASFSDVIEKISSQISQVSDRTLLTEWNRLLQELKSEREMSANMKEVLLGNFDVKQARRDKLPSRDEHSEKELQKIKQNCSDDMGDGRNSLKPNFKKQVVHEDDEVYNKKEKEMKDREKESEREREQREKEFEERDAEIWPKKKPVMKKNSNKAPVQPVVANNSGVGDKNGREYGKPWLANAKKQAGKDGKVEGEEKKSFLKHCYPDGNGPDTNLIEMLEKEVVCFNPNITFDDIAELEKAKDVLEEAVLLPLMMPHLFTGIRRAWKGVLLFGPPGTGKTLLAKAIASGGKTTFFNVTSSSLASKWKGESQKLVRLLFQMAAFYAPATIFIDEIDALASKRGEKEDESSRKVKTELMTRIDGVSSGEEGKSIVVIGATNRPWDLDEAIRRRLEKRIYIPLPTEVGRREMLRINLKDEKTEAVEIEELVKKTDGYSGADIALLCREAAYMPMRRKLKREGGLGKRLNNLEWRKEFEKEVTVPLTMEDFVQALKNVKPSVGKGDLANYEQWMAEFGEQGTS